MQLHLFGSFGTETSDTQGRLSSFYTLMGEQREKRLPLNYATQYHLLKYDWQTIPKGFHEILNFGMTRVCVAKMSTVTSPASFRPTGHCAEGFTTSARLLLPVNRLESRGKIEILSRACQHEIQVVPCWWPLKSSQLLKPKRTIGFSLGPMVQATWWVLSFLLRWRGPLLHQWHQRNLFHRKHPKQKCCRKSN